MAVNDTPLVSIVTPVHNGESYLDNCINSVRSQTYENWEYIIVDNCSTDGTGDIARKHSAEDTRIKFYRTSELLPLIPNHNFALQQLSPGSQYCKIVHVDDQIFPPCVELMVAAGEKHPSANIVGSYCLWNERVVSDGIPLGTALISGRDLCRKTLLNQLYCFWSPSALLLRSSCIRKRGNFYNGDHLHADVEACYEVLEDSDFAFVHQVLTFIRKHEASATSRLTGSYNKIILSNLDLYLRFGPIFLSQNEFQSHLKVKAREYYAFLAASVLEFREKEFWRYHQQTCRAMGFPLRWSKLARVIIWKAIGQPGPAMERLTRAVARELHATREK